MFVPSNSSNDMHPKTPTPNLLLAVRGHRSALSLGLEPGQRQRGDRIGIQTNIEATAHAGGHGNPARMGTDV